MQRERALLTIMSEDGPVQESYRQYIREIELRHGEHDENVEKTKELWVKLESKLQSTSFVRSGLFPIVACKLDLHWTCQDSGGEPLSFADRLDTNEKLIGCANGVYNLETGEFRTGEPGDLISLSTHVDYIPYPEHPQEIREGLEAFIAKIFVNPVHRAYFMQELASCLNSSNSRNRFYILTGAGLTENRPFQLCQARAAQIRGKRIVTCSEPNARDSLNLGTIKWLTGGDRVTARNLYENNMSFYLNAAFFMLANEIPEIKAPLEDFGTWRRIKPAPFQSSFKEQVDPNNPLEFQTDENMNDKLSAWRNAFFALLIQTYPFSDFRDVFNEYNVFLETYNGNGRYPLTFLNLA
ncbi:hypothetical protein HDU81_008581 [Chytriomyces hyalinus]|nr:hypothetical protein HDU81_008581 [Chytriomyces hyalinus]